MTTQEDIKGLPVSQSPLVSQNNTAVTAASTACIPRNVNTEFGYYTEPEGGGPAAPINVIKDRNPLKLNWQPATVYDVRGSSVTHSLHTTGIQYTRHKSTVEDFTDDAIIKKTYYSEITDLLYKITGASEIRIFNHTVRQAPIQSVYLKNSTVQEKIAMIDERSGKSSMSNFPRGPVRNVHIDYSYPEAPKLLAKKYPHKAEQLLKRRFQIINIWRPIKTIYKDPFAVLDATSVLEEELVPLLVIQPNDEFESFNVQPALKGRIDAGHMWYYMSKQTPDDVLLFKIFDSENEGTARRVPHSSFEDKEFEDMDLRESIEVRAFIFYKDNVK